MKIPIFEEIKIDDFMSETYFDDIEEDKIGRVPTYFNLIGLKRSLALEVINKLQGHLKTKNKNPYFPYPTYLVSNLSFKEYELSYNLPLLRLKVVKSVNDLPDHFFKKVKRPNAKELGLLSKLYMKVDKLEFLNLNELQQSFIKSSLSDKELFERAKELSFLEKIFYAIQEKHKKKSHKHHE